MEGRYGRSRYGRGIKGERRISGGNRRGKRTDVIRGLVSVGGGYWDIWKESLGHREKG